MAMNGRNIPMKIVPSEPLSKHTSFRTGGQARFFVEANSVEDLREAVARAKKDGLPFIVIGEGSNTLVSDNGFPGYIIRPLIKGMEFLSDTLVVAGAGEHWDDLVALTVSKNLSGLENLSWIPGSVGAAPVQNIGAYGGEIKDVLAWVEAYDPKTDSLKTFTNAECRFDYRESLFKSEKGRDLIITRAAFQLKTKNQPNISYKDLKNYFLSFERPPTVVEVRDAVVKIRKEKLPSILEYGTAGSFFKNPIISDAKYAELAEKFPGLMPFPAHDGFKKISLAWVLDKACGLKGYREGNVGLYEKQPLAVVNFGGATTAEIKKFVEKISKIVKDKTGLDIEWEVNFI